MSVTVLIPAAGMGRRMGAAVNKQYLHLAGRPILAHTLELFERHPAIDHLYVIVPPDEVAYCRREVVERFGFAKVRQVVAGGAERQDSVRHGLDACGAADEDLVVIHDGVRPLFPPALIGPLLERASEVGACVVGMPVKDTVKEVDAGLIAATPQRSRLWLAQTPQAFRFALLREAHRRALEEGFAGTDDASLVERLGVPVAMLEGSYRNLKITTPEDLVVARALLESPQGDGQ